MSVVFSGSTQGVFTSTGVAVNLSIREDVDYIRVYNQTKLAANATSTGLEFYWQRGMAAGTGIEYQNNSAGTATFVKWLTTGGFTLYDNTIPLTASALTLSAISNATPPVVTTADTSSLNTGDTVRIFNTTGAQQLGGLDFTITVINGTTFSLAYMRSIVAGTTGTFRKVRFNRYFYPPTRVISKIGSSTLNGSNVAIVTLTVTHAYTVGQKIRFLIPTVTATAFGMTQLNQVEATIVAVNAADTDAVTNTITVDVDVSTFGTFAWPLTTNGAFTPAQVVPVGENTAQANASLVNPFADSEVNNGAIGITLAAGVDSPAGQNNDVIYWVAGKSFNT